MRLSAAVIHYLELGEATLTLGVKSFLISSFFNQSYMTNPK